MNRLDAFAEELEYIKNEQIKSFAIAAIQLMPNYFFTIPASSTGKYHPNYALGDGGLYRHTVAAVRIALELFRTELWAFTDNQKDVILVSLMLHDGWKSGIMKEQFTRADHPNIAKFALDESGLQHTFHLPDYFYQDLTDNIQTHMGIWNYDYKNPSKELMPKPHTTMQRFVHLCDYIASRKCLEFNFDVPISDK